MKSRTKAALFGAGAMLSAAVVRGGIDRAIDRNLVGEALDREEPRTMTRLKARLKGYREEDPPEWDRMRQRLEQIPHETVRMASFDKTWLTGHLYRVAEPKRVILAMHGWRSGWSRDFGMIADFLHENNCTVLYAEQRGQGSSDGKYMGFGMIERYDCLEWIRWLNENGMEKLPIYLAGISMGAATVLMTAGFETLPRNVAGIIADCGFTSAKAVWKHVSETNLRIPYKHHQHRVDGLCRRRIDVNADGYSTLDAMKTNVTPILFIHGTGDTFVPPEMSRETYAACTAPKKLLLVEGANHGMSYLTDRKAYEQAVLDFWEENDVLKN